RSSLTLVGAVESQKVRSKQRLVQARRGERGRVKEAQDEDADAMASVIEEPHGAWTDLGRPVCQLSDAEQHVIAGSVLDRVDGQEIRLSRSAQGLCLLTYAERQRAGHVGGAGEQAAARVLVRQRAAILERHAH